jgi:hypothetical protein
LSRTGNKLFSFLQERLQNRLLQFSVIIEEQTGRKAKGRNLINRQRAVFKNDRTIPDGKGIERPAAAGTGLLMGNGEWSIVNRTPGTKFLTLQSFPSLPIHH